MRHIRRPADPTLMLINVVFLLLAFFVIAGTIAARPPAGLTLVSLAEGEPAPAADMVLLGADGAAIWPEGVTDAAGLVAALPAEAGGRVWILPDRAAPAQALVQLARGLAAAGAGQVRLLAERGAGGGQ